eukprot:TRINITY_DN619_c0_g1_i1.p1 TRINITY_DN619_c0_g1~~TRINITY_DN619_c0_g1_i1.p1  ORF type:complete len:220 (+),score=47.61 TRINITY_DN619_c0_g1_i1:37-696(+)
MQQAKEQAGWSPYVNNGGTTLAVSGKDFCIIAGDTRMSSGYSIHTRNSPKVLKLTEHAVLATAGMQADTAALHKVLRARLQSYEYTHRKPMGLTAIAQLLSTTLYGKRFFPYYTFNVLGGVDEKGEGCCYSYDAVGSFERVHYSSSGTGNGLIQPLLDNQLGWKGTGVRRTFSVEEATNLVRDAYTSAGERDIYTGDSVDLFIVTSGELKQIRFPLKQD